MLDIRKMKERRLELDLTQEEVAKSSGITQMHYSAIERGAKNASLDVAEMISHALKLKGLDVILLASNPPHPPLPQPSRKRGKKPKAKTAAA